MTVYIGIDMGIAGQIALLYAGRVTLIKLGDDPARTVGNVIRRIGPSRVSIVIEKTWGSKGMSAMSAHTFGIVAGRVMGALEVLNAPYRAVRPQEWKALILKGTDKSKEAAVSYVRNAYPDAKIFLPRGKPDHNAADAVCMAEYAMRIDSK